MSDLLIEARFPTGQFNAAVSNEPEWDEVLHQKLRKAEWPPSPGRMLAAALAGAHTTGDRLVVEAVEKMFGIETPPTVVATRVVGVRGQKFRRWVPKQMLERAPGESGAEYFPGIEAMIQGGRYVRSHVGSGPKDSKTPEPGVWVGEGRAVLAFHGAGDEELAGLLQRAFDQVCYLGRPTSPVVVDVSCEELHVRDDESMWVPDNTCAATTQLSVPSLAELRRLNDKYEAALRLREAGANPDPSRLSAAKRSMSGYRLVAVDSEPHDMARWASRETATAVASEYLYRVVESPHGRAAAASDTLALIAELMVDPTRPVIPVFDGDRIPGVFVRATRDPVNTIAVLLRGGLATARLERRIPREGRTALRKISGTAQVWTTIVPITRDRNAIAEELTKIAACHGAEVDWAQMHDEPLGPGLVLVDDRPDLTHVTVRFTEPVYGPLIIPGTVMWLLGEAR